MNKKFKPYFISWAILFVVFNVIVFAMPGTVSVAGEEYSKFGGAFWAGYIFITLAFIGQLVCAYIALNTESNTKLFYNIPIIRISYAGLVLTLIFGGLCMAVPNLPNWVGIIICLLILAFNAIAVVKASAASDIVATIDDKIKSQTQFIKLLTVDAQGVLNRAKTDEEKQLAQKVYEAIRYSDPMSSDALAVSEAKITIAFDEFSKKITSENADELVNLLQDRNNKCKVLK